MEIDPNLTLSQLWEKYGRSRYVTDKGDGHSYLPVYDILFEPYKYRQINVFEIGHSAGGALRLFEDYFPNAMIYGIDQSDNDWWVYYQRAPYNTNRVKTYIKDVHTLSEEWFKEVGWFPDIVIEDSNHLFETQKFVINTVLPLIRPGGMLIIEDVLDPQERGPWFEALGKCQVVDLNPIMYTRDNALVIFNKE